MPMESNMRISKILCISHTKDYGGGEECLKDCLIALDSSPQFQVVLLAPEGILSEKMKTEIPVKISKGIGQLYRKTNRLWILELLRRFITSFFEVLYYGIQQKPNIIYCFSNTALFYAVLPGIILRKRIVCELQFVIENNLFWERLSLFLGRQVHKFIVPSEAVKSRLVDIGHNSDKIIVLNNSVDNVNTFNPESISFGVFRDKLGFSHSNMLIGTIGQICSLKGQHVFLKAINLLNQIDRTDENTKYLVIGGPKVGSEREYFGKLKDYVAKKHLTDKVFFIGYLATELIPHALKDLNVFVFCSVLPDAQPLAVIEAMAMRKLIVASNIGGVPEVIEDGVSGILYEPGNPKELAKRIKHVIDNISSLKGMGDRARGSVERKFSKEIFRKNRIATFSQIVGNNLDFIL